MKTIERIYQPSQQDFTKHFLEPQKPCVIVGAINDWQALSLWNLDYFKKTIGHKIVRCRVSDNDYFDNYHPYEAIKLSKFIDSLVEENQAFSQIFTLKKTSKKYFVGSLDIPTNLPELSTDIQLPYFFNHKLLVSYNLWIGKGNNRVNLHYDLFPNLNVQIIGQKHWIIFSPEQSSLLYPYPWYNRFFWCSKVNINQPDYQQFSKFSQAQPLEVITEPGDMIFLPAFWWHSPVGIGLNVAVNFWWRMTIKELGKALIKKILK